MLPKFNANTSYIPLADGIYFRSNQASLRLQGKSLYRLVEHLIPYLNGCYSLEEITQGLDTARKAMITSLIETLVSHRFVTDACQDLAHGLSDAEFACYAANIAFIESFHPSAAHHFELFRNLRLLVIGSGLSCIALVQASLACGIRQIKVVITPECPALTASQLSGSESFAFHDPAQTVQILDNPRWHDETAVLNVLQDCDVVLHLSDRAMLARAQLLNKLCVEQQKICVQAAIVEHHAWIGPLVSSEISGCWECAWRRLQSHLTNISEQLPLYAFLDHPTTSPDQPLTEPVATMLANRLVFELFKHITQAGTVEIATALIDLDLTTLLCERHVALSHPLCQACQHPAAMSVTRFREQMQQLQYQDEIDVESFVRVLVGCTDAQLGLFSSLQEGDFARLPLTVCEIGLPNPLLVQDKIHTAIGVDVKMHDARLSAYRTACARYAANLVDPRRLLPYEAIQQSTVPRISCDQVIDSASAPTDTVAWTWAMDLHTQKVCLLPAFLAFPSLQDGQSTDMGERGIGLGMSWAEAVCQALLDWGTYLTVAQLRDVQRPYAQVDLATSPMTPSGTYLYRLLKAVEARIAIYDITGMLQIPTFAICVGAHTIAYSAHCAIAPALEAGLKLAVQHYQSLHFQQPAYAPTCVVDLPLDLRGDHLCVPQTDIPPAWPARQSWLLQSLQHRGIHALALPLDHDPALNCIVPYVTRILLAYI